MEHFTPPAVLGEHELVLETLKRKKKAQAEERARRVLGNGKGKGAASSPSGASGSGDAAPLPASLQRRYTAVAASRCVVASVPALVFRQLVLEHGSGVRPPLACITCTTCTPTHMHAHAHAGMHTPARGQAHTRTYAAHSLLAPHAV